MKAYCDFGSQDSRYVNLRRGKPAQLVQAQALRRDAGVPEGPCGLPEIDTFQKHLTEYQIVVLSLDHMYQIIFKGPPRDKHIILIKVGNHYHGCNSLSGFLGSVHLCIDCETSYAEDNYSHHPCKGKKCQACHQTGCVDFAPGQIPHHQCPRYHRAFFREQCMGNHYIYSTTDGKRADAVKKSKTSATPYASVKSVTDSYDPTRSKRVTCVVLLNVLPANNITIFKLINATFRIPPSWKKRGNSSDPENAKLTVPTLKKRKSISLFIGTVKPCRTRAFMCPI